MWNVYIPSLTQDFNTETLVLLNLLKSERKMHVKLCMLLGNLSIRRYVVLQYSYLNVAVNDLYSISKVFGKAGVKNASSASISETEFRCEIPVLACFRLELYFLLDLYNRTRFRHAYVDTTSFFGLDSDQDSALWCVVVCI